MAKTKETKPSLDKYEKSMLAVNGTFEQFIAAFFLGKPKDEPKAKE